MAAAAASSAAPSRHDEQTQTLHKRPPRCAHVILERDEPSLATALSRELDLPRERVDELLRLGAVHFSLVPPALQPGAPIDPRIGAEGAIRARNAALERWGAHSRLSSPRRIFSALQPCPAHSFARVHLRPWRAAPEAATALRLLHVSPSCVVVDKPASLPVPPAVDNAVDCAAHLAAVALEELGEKLSETEGGAAGGHTKRRSRWGRGVRARGPEEAAILDALEEACGGVAAPKALRPVHRLDTGTSGVLVLARTQAFASWWAGRQRAKTAEASVEEDDDDDEDRQQQHATKLYRCLTLAPSAPPTGTHVHWAITRYRPAAAEASGDDAGATPDAAARPPPPPPLPERTLMFGSRAEAEAFLATSGPGARAERLLRRAGGNAAAVTPASAKRCELEVLSVRRVEGAAAGWEALVELRTGRTHQIRAQMAALGCPLAGDGLYGGGGGGGGAKGEDGGGGDGDGDNWQARPLGLQAAELRVYDPEGLMGASDTSPDGWATFRAARPWWWGEDEEEGG
jgi:23S rRNA-/tRNA-specific pseudouridylate synthase